MPSRRSEHGAASEVPHARAKEVAVPVSQCRMEDWRCTHCSEVTSQLTWLAVDARERPDLIAGFSNLVEIECPKLPPPGETFPALLVLRLAKAAPLIAAQADDDQRDPIESFGEVVAAVRRELDDALREVPGPAVPVTFAEIEVGEGRDIDADVGASSTDVDTADRQALAYRELLSKIRGSQQQQRLQAGLQHLERVGSEEQLREVVERWPETVSSEAERLVVERQEQATTEEARHFAKSMVENGSTLPEGRLCGRLVCARIGHPQVPRRDGVASIGGV